VGVTALLDEIAGIGRDRRTGGYRRFAFSREDAALGEWFAAACAGRGLDVTTDRCGNQWGWWGDPDASPGVVTGSHLDSVPDGGAFDGPLGVASALAAVDTLRRSRFRPARPIGVVRFVDEEGSRFGLACSGSRLLTGTADPEKVLGLRDADGTAYAEALAATGTDPRHAGPDPAALHRIGALVELHVEQGRGLVDAGVPVGVAGMIRPHGRWRVDLAGRADHAGTAPLAGREDPMLELAELIQRTRAAAVEDGALATVGKLEVWPNAVNAIPSRVSAWLDVRADTERQVRDVLGRLSGYAPVEESWSPATWLDAALRERVAVAVRSVHGPPQAGGAPGAPVLASGAGHDAGVLAAAGIAAAMLFVRNPTGVSHSPAEHATDADCDAGVEALTAVLAGLAS
jgi:N-carbamoyl-L-amino-acid hydrolase